MSSHACEGKKQYSTWASASREAKSLRRRKGAVAGPYACSECPGYHVGNAIGGHHLAGRMRRRKLQKIEEREAWS